MKNLYSLTLCVLFALNLHAQDFYFNILEPLSIYDSYDSQVYSTVALDGTWGWDAVLDQEIIGELVRAEEFNDLHVFCEATATDFTGKIVLIDRGECQFSEKATFAQDQGAIAVVIANNVDGPVIAMGAGNLGAQVTIPIIMMPKLISDSFIAVLDEGTEVIASFTFEPNASTFVTGHMIVDDGDCLPDADPINLAGYQVTIQNDQLTKTIVANSQGFYSTSIFPGMYEISVSPNNAELWTACPPFDFTIEEQEVLEIDLPVNAALECPYLTVDVTNSIMRRCFDTNVFYINYCNEGSALAEDAFIQFYLPDLITIVSSTAEYTEVADNLFEFPLGDLNIGQCGTIKVNFLLSCDAEFEQVLCATAEIFPHDPCIGTDAWSGVDVRADAICNGDEVVLSLVNQGSEDMPESKGFRVIGDNTIIKVGDFQLAAGETMTLPFAASGYTYRLETDELPFNPVSATPSAAIELCIDASSPVAIELGYINQYPPANYGDFYDRECNEVVGSYDPNDKQANIEGYGPKHYIDQNVPLEYKIRFQNTGSDTAFTVRILDTLSQWLDLASIRPLSSSHDYSFTLEGNILDILYTNILLPDSTTNEPASNGFITFRINQKTDVALESEITNSAGIYFDFNEPIITNTVLHTVGKDFLPVVLNTNNLPSTAYLDFFPNPAYDELTIQLKENNLVNSQFMLYNNLGELVQTALLDDLSSTVSLKALAGGAYYFTIQQETKLVTQGKLMIVQ